MRGDPRMLENHPNPVDCSGSAGRAGGGVTRAAGLIGSGGVTGAAGLIGSGGVTGAAGLIGSGAGGGITCDGGTASVICTGAVGGAAGVGGCTATVTVGAERAVAPIPNRVNVESQPDSESGGMFVWMLDDLRARGCVSSGETVDGNGAAFADSFDPNSHPKLFPTLSIAVGALLVGFGPVDSDLDFERLRLTTLVLLDSSSRDIALRSSS